MRPPRHRLLPPRPRLRRPTRPLARAPLPNKPQRPPLTPLPTPAPTPTCTRCLRLDIEDIARGKAASPGTHKQRRCAAGRCSRRATSCKEPAAASGQTRPLARKWRTVFYKPANHSNPPTACAARADYLSLWLVACVGAGAGADWGLRPAPVRAAGGFAFCHRSCLFRSIFPALACNR